MPPKTSSQELVPPDISYTIVDTITSLSVPLAEAEILVKNVCFLQCIDMKKETGFDECKLVPFLCAFLLS